MNILDQLSTLQLLAELQGVALPHTIEDEVGPTVAEDALAQFVLPVVVMGQSAERGFDAAQCHGNVGIELLEDLGVDDGGIVGAQVVPGVGTVGILMAQPSVGRVVVDHGVHGTG